MNISIGKSQIIMSVLSLLLCAQSFAQSDTKLESDDARIAYSIGVGIGQNLQAQQILDGIELDTFIVGLLDAVNDNLRMSSEEMLASIQVFQQRMEEQQQAALAASAATNEDFLRANALKEGVVALQSGLQYLILESGPQDGASPAESDTVLAHYHGTLIDGTVFDSSVDRGEPVRFGLSQVISGWTEALQLMKAGDKWRLFIPAAMAYGEASPTAAIPPNSALIFDVELLEIRQAPEPGEQQD